MVARARKELIARRRHALGDPVQMRADMRYRGQSYEIEVPLSPRFIADFHEAHRRTFGYAAPDAAVEAVNLRLRARGGIGDHAGANRRRFEASPIR